MGKEKVLVTGGAGYLGNVITRRLLDENYEVTCLDNLMYRQDAPISALSSNSDFDFIYGDVQDNTLLKKLVPDFDIIIPLAAIVGMPACNRRPFLAGPINRDAVINLNEARSNSQRVIFPNTNSGYGTKSGEFHCTEETPLEPISLYGITKVEAERALLDSDKDSIVLRLASVFGMSQRMRLELSFHDMVVQALKRKAIVLTEGDSTRNYVYIQDVAGAFLHSIEHYEEMVDKRVFNLGSDDANITKRGLAEKVQEHISGTQILEDEITQDVDKRNYLVSNERLRKAGFEATTSISQGIAEVTKGVAIMLENDPHSNM